LASRSYEANRLRETSDSVARILKRFAAEFAVAADPQVLQ
jgi:hypothetical protein